MIGIFIFQIFGAIIVWACKGFKGSINDEMAGPNDDNWKKHRNFIISVVILLLIAQQIDRRMNSKRGSIKTNNLEILQTR